MIQPNHKVAIIIPTKDRPDDLRRMLGSIHQQSVKPHQIVVVDASIIPVSKVIDEFTSINITYLRHLPPSSAKQRNIGLTAIHDDIDLIGFMDDDIVLEINAIEKMIIFWDSASNMTAGASLNFNNSFHPGLNLLKRLRLASTLGFYNNHVGSVALSGWATAINNVDTTIQVQWLPTTAVFWRRDLIRGHKFDDFFEGYSYLEDLDFSYEIGKNYKLVIVADAKFSHFPSSTGRISDYQFGKMEVINRLYFVRKHNLSASRCYMGLFYRFVMSLGSSITGSGLESLHRIAGNCTGLFQSLIARHIVFSSDSTK